MTRVNRFRTVVFTSWVLLLFGCSSTLPSSSQEESTVIPTETREASTPTTEGNTVQMTPTISTPADAGLQSLINKAKEDLAQRLSIPVPQINLVDATEVEWSDSSLDCPQPGMEYLQVITPGYRILLQANDQVYEYHSNRDTYFVYCENQFPTLDPKP